MPVSSHLIKPPISQKSQEKSDGRSRLQSARGGDTLCSRDCPAWKFGTEDWVVETHPGQFGLFFLKKQLGVTGVKSYKLFTIGRKLRKWKLTMGMNHSNGLFKAASANRCFNRQNQVDGWSVIWNDGTHPIQFCRFFNGSTLISYWVRICIYIYIHTCK